MKNTKTVALSIKEIVQTNGGMITIQGLSPIIKIDSPWIGSGPGGQDVEFPTQFG